MYWSVAEKSWKIPAGSRVMWVGNSSRALLLKASVK
ncbi:MAG: hypothetical protein ACRYFU_02715 [Janthinobacterium lividum]